jgi:SAM-dependent methyltransferase
MFSILFIIIFVLLASAAYAAHRGAPWVPTWKKDLLRIEKLARLQKNEKFIELGCGTGRVCRSLSKNSQAEIYGIELSILQWMCAIVLTFLSSRAKRVNTSGVEGSLDSLRSLEMTRPIFFLGDVFHHDFSSYDVVYMFLMPETYAKLRDKLTSELKPGSRVISYVWPVPGWTPSQIDRVEGSPDIYLYTKK